ncbi:unnamed protein product, partial [Brachionus calyciflorus]
METNLDKTPQHPVFVTQVSETSKRCQTNTSPSSPPDERFVNIADFSTWKAKLLIMETLINSKDSTILDLSNKITDLTKRVEQLETELKDAKIASQAVAQVEGKKVDRPHEQIEVLNSVVSEQRERERRKKNVIVFGVQMSTKTSQKAQVADDTGLIERAFKAVKIDVGKIKYIRRFKPNPSLNRPPPILIQT